ncbi:MAG: hypothetical protein ACUVUB_05880 [Candidatus Bathyarchaeia archaeon]
MGWRHRRRHGRRGCFPKPISIEKPTNINKFSPTPETNPTPIYIEPAEIEVLRLVDLEGLSQEEPFGDFCRVPERKRPKPSQKEGLCSSQPKKLKKRAKIFDMIIPS